jgi:uncharacterized protein YkwD
MSFAEREFSPRCRELDGALARVALRIASGQMGTDSADVVDALREAGAPYVWPRAWSLSGRNLDMAAAKQRLDAWLSGFVAPNHLRCGLASTRTHGETVYAAVAIDAIADLSALPRRVTQPTWLDFTAEILVPATGAKLAVAPPSGTPFNVPTSFVPRRARARIHVDRPGTWRLSLIVDEASGPRPALQADIVMGDDRVCDRPRALDKVENAGSDPEAAIARMIGAARRDESLPALARDASLDALARAHSTRMMRSSRLAHDVGDGDPRERLATSPVAARELAENVAHAAGAAEAHRALWDSPSHRENIVGPRFDHVGVGAVRGADGTLWVTEIFARLQ